MTQQEASTTRGTDERRIRLQRRRRLWDSGRADLHAAEVDNEAAVGEGFSRVSGSVQLAR
jgi:hypothetical protein